MGAVEWWGAMRFLAPLFLLGALAVVLPLLFHLIRQTTRRQQWFSSLRFLETSPPRLTRRSRLQHWLLLLLRGAVIGLLALAFARPFFDTPVLTSPARARPQTTLLLVDTSASMRRDGLWEAAQERANSWIQRAGPEDTMALLSFDDSVTTLFGLAEWATADPATRQDECRRRLRAVAPGWGATHLDRALIRASELLAEAGATTSMRRVVLIGDLQEGCQRSALPGHDWPRGLQVVIERVRPHRPGNAGLAWLRSADRAASGVGERALPVRIGNSPDAVREAFELRWESGSAAPPVAVQVAAGTSRRIPLPQPPAEGTVGTLVLSGDDAAFDNRLHLVLAARRRVGVFCLSAEPAGDSAGLVYYLSRAFPEEAGAGVDLTVARDLPAAGEVKPMPVLVFLLQPPTVPQAEALNAFARQGGMVVAVIGAGGGGEPVGRLWGVPSLEVREGPVARSGYVLLGDIEFSHPLFAAFADPRYSDFSKVHFWKYRRVEGGLPAEARVLARFDSGDPAWIEVPVGRGTVLVLTSGWTPADSELARSTKFAPLLHTLVELAAGERAGAAQWQVGDTVVLPESLSSGSLVLERPDGERVALAPGTRQYGPLDQPGLYACVGGGERWPFAVNLDPAESRTAPLGADELAGLGVPLSAPESVEARSGERQQQVHRAELENRQKLWRIALLVVLGFVLGETWLAAAMTRRASRQAGGEESAAPGGGG